MALTPPEVTALNSCANALMGLARDAGMKGHPLLSKLKRFGFRISCDALASLSSPSGANVPGGIQQQHGSGSGQSQSSMPSSPMSTSSGGYPGAGPTAASPQMSASAAPLFPAIAAFLRTHPQLERLELLVLGTNYSGAALAARRARASRMRTSASPAFSDASSPAASVLHLQHQASSSHAHMHPHSASYSQSGPSQRAKFGYDASVLGLLPSLPALRVLAITLTRDVSAGLFAWIIPRSVEALVLSGLEALRDVDSGDAEGEWEGVRGFLRVRFISA